MALPAPICPDCGSPIASGAPGGLCVACVLMMAQGEDLSDGSLMVPATVPALRTIGQYELVREIGRGGMGVVYEARQKSLNRRVALKVILAGEFASEEAIARFTEEAKAIGTLDHPHIIPIYEVGEHEGRNFYVMKLIDGESLAQWILKSKMLGSSYAASRPSIDVRHSAHLVSKIARAVHFVHQRGILHRDLSPENILLDAAGEPWVTDFGLARLLDPDRRLTRTYTIVGKPDYMAPEQADPRGPGLTTATDLFSLGTIFYELLTGERPFAAATPLATLERVRNENPRPPSALNAGIDKDLNTICLKCLYKEPAGRYGSAGALADDLDCWLAGRPIVARPIGGLERSWKWTRRHPLKAAMAGVSLLAVLGPLAVSLFYYSYLLPHQARTHPTFGRDHNINGFTISFETRHPERATMNFDPFSFRDRPRPACLYLTNVSPETMNWFSGLRCQVMADTIGVPNEPRGPVVRSGERFMIETRKRRDRAYYVAPVAGWQGEDVLARAPDARLCVMLLDEE